MRSIVLAGLLSTTLAMSDAAIAVAQQRQSPAQGSWGGMMSRWPTDRGMMWPDNNSMPRHHLAMMWGIPAPYRTLSNPLPHASATVDRGAKVYAQNCVSCHGATGRGDGESGRGLTPPPGNLAWLSQMPLSQWDPFMYWTVAEGGTPLGTSMPSFKDSLSKEDMWAVIAYIQARLPQRSKQP